jgi:hypothetical protein
LGTRDDAQLFGQSRTLRIKQLLGLDGSMAHLDLAAPSTDILPNPTIFIPFRGPAGPAASSCETRPKHPGNFLFPTEATNGFPISTDSHDTGANDREKRFWRSAKTEVRCIWP